MKYDLYLFDADDTLFDFKGSEILAFKSALQHHGHTTDIETLYETYNQESLALWRDLEQGKITKDFLKGERFRRTFAKHAIELPSEDVGETYLEKLPETCLLIDHAVELCKELSQRAKVGIITNGFEKVQTRRLKGSGLQPYVHFMVISEQCGFIKPDVRFFEYTAKQVDGFDKKKTLVVGDRLETDIAGAIGFGVDSCWYNPRNQVATSHRPTYEITHLSQLLKI